MAKKQTPLNVETLTHEEARRKNIPTAEYQSVMQKEEQSPVRVAYERGVAGLEKEKADRNRDLDPQLVWRGEDEQDWSELVVQAPPLYIQEKVHPKVLIDDLLRQTEQAQAQQPNCQVDLFADFNGTPVEAAKTEFYKHDANWTNRMILGDNLQVMASLAEREGLLGKVQCFYNDPPYGIKFNSNFQWSTTSRDVKDGKPDIDILPADGGQIRVKVNGVDVFHPNTGEVRSEGPDGIACWFIDTDYNEESFFVRHAYFLGANDPYKSLKTTLKAEINEEAWASLNSDTSRPFDKPKSGRIAVKVINHLGDEVMKVFRV